MGIYLPLSTMTPVFVGGCVPPGIGFELTGVLGAAVSLIVFAMLALLLYRIAMKNPDAGS